MRIAPEKQRVLCVLACLAASFGAFGHLADAAEPKTIYLCNRHGILKSTDGGQSYRLVHKCSP